MVRKETELNLIFMQITLALDLIYETSYKPHVTSDQDLHCLLTGFSIKIE